MNTLTFEIPGVIQPQERPRLSKQGKGMRTHDALRARISKTL